MLYAGSRGNVLQQLWGEYAQVLSEGSRTCLLNISFQSYCNIHLDCL